MRRTKFVLTLFAGAMLLQAAQVSIPKPSLPPGGSVTAEITYAAQGAAVTGLQFDLQYPTSVTVAAAAGPAATAAGKSLSFADLGSGRRRFVIAGLNQTAIGDGVLVVLTISAQIGAAPGVYAQSLINPFATDRNGGALPLASVDGSVTIGSPAALPTIGAFPQIASGQSWKTTITLLNLSSTPSAVRLNFWDNNGTALPLPVTSSQLGGETPVSAASPAWTIPGNGLLIVETEAPPSSGLLVGWAELQSPGDVVGQAVFRQRVVEGRDAEAVVPFENRNRATYLMPFDETRGFITGFAIANLSTTASTTVNFTFKDEAGLQIAVDSLPLQPRGHTSYTWVSRLPSLANRRGTLEIRTATAGSVAGLGLRFNPFSSFTSIPLVPK